MRIIIFFAWFRYSFTFSYKKDILLLWVVFEFFPPIGVVVFLGTSIYTHAYQLQLQNYAKTEEAKVEELIKAVADSGAKVIVSGAAVGEMALHFCERYKYVEFSFFLFG